MKHTDDPIIFEQTYAAPIATVWSALTEPELMSQWFFEKILTFEPKVGFETRFAVQSGRRVFLHQWKVIEVEPGKRIAYEWSYSGYSGSFSTLFELSEQGGSTGLRLTVDILKDFEEGIPEFERESCVGGWDNFLGQRLTRYLAG